ncbi:MAG: hypothetical protein AB7G06_04770 [Bdellovibrionales bacterium]
MPFMKESGQQKQARALLADQGVSGKALFKAQRDTRSRTPALSHHLRAHSKALEQHLYEIFWGTGQTVTAVQALFYQGDETHQLPEKLQGAAGLGDLSQGRNLDYVRSSKF